MRLLCFGDSNTYGYDPHSYFGDRYPADVRWADLLAQETGWEVQNAGMNGRMIPTAPTVRLPDADVLVVMLGSNDLLNGYSAQETAARMERFLSQAGSCCPHILLVAPPPMKYGDWAADERLLAESARLAAHYRALARQLGIWFADAGDWNVELTFDGVHFSQAGHRTFASGLRQALLNQQENIAP